MSEIEAWRIEAAYRSGYQQGVDSVKRVVEQVRGPKHSSARVSDMHRVNILETQLAEAHRQLDNVMVERDAARKKVAKLQEMLERAKAALYPIYNRYNMMCPTMPS